MVILTLGHRFEVFPVSELKVTKTTVAVHVEIDFEMTYDNNIFESLIRPPHRSVAYVISILH